MTKEELIQNIDFLYNRNSPIGIKLYFVLQNGGETEIRFADISDKVATDLKSEFLSYLKGRLVNNPELNYAPITEADNTSNSIYHYDLQEHPVKLQPLYDVNEAEIFTLNQNPPYPNFSFKDNDLSKITAFVICLGNEANKIVLYKRHYPLSLLKQGSYYGLIPHNTRFEKFNSNMLRMNDTVEFMLVDSKLVVFSLRTFENQFGYDQIIRNKATENLQTIGNADILEDIEVLRELAGELKYAKKLMNIKHDSVVLRLPFRDVRTFIQNHPKLKRRIKFNADQSRISLISRASKELFLKILNDDFLKSDLTQTLYDSLKKNPMDNTEEPEE